jgi:arabinogalactan oligomer / maltooligosaccharide transport system permease protein
MPRYDAITTAREADGRTPFGTSGACHSAGPPGLPATALYSFVTAWAEVAYASQSMGADHYTLAFGIRMFVTDQRADWQVCVPHP